MMQEFRKLTKGVTVIIGGSGQDGFYLHRLLNKFETVVILDQNRPLYRLGSNSIFRQIELQNPTSVFKELDSYSVSRIYNLASLSSVVECEKYPERSYKINYLFVSQLIEFLLARNTRYKVRLLQASSSEIFGHQSKMLCDENSKFEPFSTYGNHKLLAHKEIEMARNMDFFACNAILFNHESPMRQDHFVSKKIIKGVVEIAYKTRSQIVLGNVNIKRDWGFAGDYVKAMVQIISNKNPKDYVVGSGLSYSIKEFCSIAFREVGIKNFEEFIKIDEALLRPDEPPCLIADAGKIRDELGWKPYYNFDQLIKLLVRTEIMKKRLGFPIRIKTNPI